jgi:hypothetical protein
MATGDAMISSSFSLFLLHDSQMVDEARLALG